MSATSELPKWDSDRVVDPDGWWLWLAVDAFPDEESALTEACRGCTDGPKIIGRERMRLRWADEDDEGDAYLMYEWDIVTIAEPHPEGDREFWSIQMVEEATA